MRLRFALAKTGLLDSGVEIWSLWTKSANSGLLRKVQKVANGFYKNFFKSTLHMYFSLRQRRHLVFCIKACELLRERHQTVTRMMGEGNQ